MVGAEAGMMNTNKSMKAYITGTTESESLISLDILGSRKTVENLHLSVDIDSVLWMTDRLKMAGTINIHLLPHKGIKAPIYKSNHAYVRLYWPQTHEDLSMGRVSSASQVVPISSC